MRDWHTRFDGGVRWRVTTAGVELEHVGTLRTPGDPLTMRKLWRDYGAPIQHTARTFSVPVELILATIATESAVKSGVRDPKQVRLEPGYQSDDATPHRISVGLGHILIDTARRVLRYPVGRAWLAMPTNNIWCIGAVIRDMADLHGFDVPLVFAAYNAGGVYETHKNMFRLRSTNDHIERACCWLGDAVAVVQDAGGCSRDMVWMLRAYASAVLL